MFTLLCYFLCVIVQDWKAYSGSPADLFELSSPLLLMNLTVSLCFEGKIASIALSWTHTASSFLLCVCSRLERYNTTPIFSFSEAFNLRSGISLAFPRIASTAVQTGACLWPPGRIERKSVFLPFTLSPFWSHERRKWNAFILGFPLLSTLHVSFLLLLFVEHTRTQTPGTVRPCSAVDIQKGPEWMAGICMHWLSACLPNISAQLMALLDTLI